MFRWVFLVSALLAGPSIAQAAIDPTHAIGLLPDQIPWVHRDGSDVYWMVGDPAKPGLCIELVRWLPHNFSHPHYHSHIRYGAVLSGTWWVGTGDTYDPETTTPFPAGSLLTDLPGKVHFDGAKDEPTVIELVMDCPLDGHPPPGK